MLTNTIFPCAFFLVRTTIEQFFPTDSVCSEPDPRDGVPPLGVGPPATKAAVADETKPKPTKPAVSAIANMVFITFSVDWIRMIAGPHWKQGYPTRTEPLLIWQFIARSQIWPSRHPGKPPHAGRGLPFKFSRMFTGEHTAHQNPAMMRLGEQLPCTREPGSAAPRPSPEPGLSFRLSGRQLQGEVRTNLSGWVNRRLFGQCESQRGN